MPITAGVASSASGMGVGSLTFAHTVSNNFDRILVVRTSARSQSGQTITGVTFNGVAMFRHSFIATSPPRAELWVLAAPSVGTFNVVVTLSANDNIVADANSYHGVDQLTPVGNAFTASDNSAAPGVNVLIAEANVTVKLVLDVMAAIDISMGTLTATVALGQTQETNLKIVGVPFINNPLLGTSRRFAAATPQTMAWTLSSATPWCVIGSYLRPARARMAFNAKGSASASFNPKTFDHALERRLALIELGVANLNPRGHHW
jgi:hypothetical protein